MPTNGSGGYTVPANTKGTAGTTIESAKYNTFLDDVSATLSNVVYRDGQGPYTANQAMGGFKFTNVGDATLRNNYASAGQVQDGAIQWAGTAGGTANSLTLTLAPVITAYATGQVIRFLSSSSANTGATIVNVNGLGFIAIQSNSAALTGGEIGASAIYEMVYTGSVFDLLNPSLKATTVQTFTSGGTWTKPAGLAYVKVRCQGAGGGGGGSTGAASQLSTGCGGGGGAYSEITLAAASLSGTEAVTIAVGGAGGASGGAGSAGGTTSFGTLASCAGGAGGFAGMAAGTTPTFTAGPATGGAAPSLGDVKFAGGNSGIGFRINGLIGFSGVGGSSQLGWGSQSRPPNGSGNVGREGGGGSGGCSNSVNTRNGGAGGGGVIIVEEFYS